MTNKDGLPEPGASVINLIDCFPSLEKLRREFDIFDFLDLCTGIEAAVLYDELYAFRSTRTFGGHPLIDPLVEEGAIKLLDDSIHAYRNMNERPRAMELYRRISGRYWMDPTVTDLGVITKTAATMLVADLAIEEVFDCNLILSPRVIPIYLSLEPVRRDRKVMLDIKTQLASEYVQLKDSLLATRGEVAYYDLERIPLPPIAFEAIRRAVTFDELGEIVLDLRRRYAGLRRTMSELRALMASRDESITDRIRVFHTLKKDIERTVEYPKPESAPTLIEIAEDVNKVTEGLVGAYGGDPLKLTKTSGPILKFVEKMAWRLRMRPLLITAQQYLNASVQEFAESTRVLFGHDLDENDCRRADAYGLAVGKYVGPLPGAPAENTPSTPEE